MYYYQVNYDTTNECIITELVITRLMNTLLPG